MTVYSSGGLVISELAARSTIPICWSLPGLRLLRLGPNCFALLPPTYKGLSFLNDSVFQRRTGDIWVGSAKHNSNLLVPAWSSSVTPTSSGTELLRSPATNCWVLKSAWLYNNCQYSGVGSDWGRSDLHNVIRKGPTLFSLLPQSRPSHYPHSEDYGRIAFLLLT